MSLIGDIALAAAAAAAGYVAYKAIQQRQEAATTTRSSGACTELAGSHPYGTLACTGASLLGGWWDTEQESKAERRTIQQTNVALNGGATVWGGTIWLRPSFVKTSLREHFDGGTTEWPIKHKNGCVPYSEHPGWKNCRPGTIDYKKAAADTTLRKRNRQSMALATENMCGCDASCDLFGNVYARKQPKQCAPISCVTLKTHTGSCK